jgi:hypothetical protein
MDCGSEARRFSYLRAGCALVDPDYFLLLGNLHTLSLFSKKRKFINTLESNSSALFQNKYFHVSPLH